MPHYSWQKESLNVIASQVLVLAMTIVLSVKQSFGNKSYQGEVDKSRQLLFTVPVGNFNLAVSLILEKV